MLELFRSRPLRMVILGAFGIRLLWMLGILLFNPEQGFYQFDSQLYGHFAGVLEDHGRFAYYNPDLEAFYPVHAHTPGYPFLIYLTNLLGLSTVGLILLQIICSTLSVMLTMRLTQLFGGSERAAIWAGGFMALDVSSVVFANLVMSESVFTFLLLLAVVLVVRSLKVRFSWGGMLIAGTLLGYGILCRPVGLYLPIAFVLALLLFNQKGWKQSWKSIAALVVGVLVVLSPWVLRNQNAFGSPFLTTLDNTNLFYYRAAGVVARRDNISLIKARRQLETKYVLPVQEQYEDRPIALSQYLRGEAMNIIASNAGIYAKIHVVAVLELMGKPMRHPIQMQFGWDDEQKTIWHWADPNEAGMWEQFKANASPFTMAMVFLQVLLLILLWIGVVNGIRISWKQGKRLLLFLVLGMCCYFALVAAGPETNARFRIPLMPYLALLSAFGWTAIRWSRKSDSPTD